MKTDNFLNYFILAIIAITVAIFAVVFLPGLRTKTLPLPNPNGYDDFVRAGEMMQAMPSDTKKLTQSQLAALVQIYEPAFKLAETGLSRQCRMPDNYSLNYPQQYFHEPMAIKSLALSLYARARLANLENRTNDAVESFLEAVILGEKSARGGHIMAKSVGMACESIGQNGLQPWTTNANEQQCQHIAQVFQSVDDEEESVAAFLTEENKYFRDASTLSQKLAAWREFGRISTMRNNFRVQFQNNQLRRRQMMLSFAARAYELNQGRLPAKITDLVPTYLKALPRDPTTGTNLALTAIPN